MRSTPISFEPCLWHISFATHATYNDFFWTGSFELFLLRHVRPTTISFELFLLWHMRPSSAWNNHMRPTTISFQLFLFTRTDTHHTNMLPNFYLNVSTHSVFTRNQYFQCTIDLQTMKLHQRVGFSEASRSSSYRTRDIEAAYGYLILLEWRNHYKWSPSRPSLLDGVCKLVLQTLIKLKPTTLGTIAKQVATHRHKDSSKFFIKIQVIPRWPCWRWRGRWWRR